MNIARRCLAFAVILTLALSAAAQQPDKFPPNSSLEQTIAWLDKTTIANARIGLEVEVDDDSVDITQRYEVPLSEWAVFSKGFRLKSIENCSLTLRNEEIELLYFATGSYNLKNVRLREYLDAPKDNVKYYAEIVIPLNNLSRKKGKKPFRHTRKAEKAKTLGLWRVMFRVSQPSFFDVIRGRIDTPDGVLIGIRSSADPQFYDSLEGDALTFTFDEKEMSERFHSAFRRTIELCTQK